MDHDDRLPLVIREDGDSVALPLAEESALSSGRAAPRAADCPPPGSFSHNIVNDDDPIVLVEDDDPLLAAGPSEKAPRPPCAAANPPGITASMLRDLVRFAQERLRAGEGGQLLAELGCDQPALIQAYGIGYLPRKMQHRLPKPMKAAFAGAGLPLLPWLLIRRAEWEREPAYVLDWIESRLTYPVFVKPANLGSSVGISKAIDRATLEHGLTEAAGYDRRIVVEQGIPAREIEVSVLGNDAPEASVPGEVIPSGEWYDYEAKYLPGVTREVTPAEIPEPLTRKCHELCSKIYDVLNCKGIVRIDYIIRDEDLYFLEINTVPGMSEFSIIPQQAAKYGIEVRELLTKVVEDGDLH